MEIGGNSTKGLRSGAVTGSTVDSIVMFRNDKQHKVIWHAPGP